MTKIVKNISKIITILSLVITSYSVSAQPPPPPGGSTGGTNNSGNSLGGNAPIGSGLFILLGLGAAYGGRKVYNLSKEKED